MQAPFASLVAPEPVGASVRLRVLSLGAGVQSTTLALMATHGEIGPMPDCAIFADTGWEPPAVYRHLAWLMAPGVLAFPVHVVSAGNIRDDLLPEARGRRRASIPAYTRTAVPAGKERPLFPKPDDRIVGLRRSSDGEDSIGMIHRHCTANYKVVPIRRKVRELAGIAGRRSPSWPVAEQWIGISLDELVRMKPSAEDWQVNRWPLVERRMTRWDCLRWLERHGYGHSRSLRRLTGEPVPLTEAEQARYDALHAEYERLEATDPADLEALEASALRLNAIDGELRALEERPQVYETAEVARAGVFVSVDAEGRLQIDRGYVRPEDEAPVEPVTGVDGAAAEPAAGGAGKPVAAQPAAIGGGGRISAPAPTTATGPEATDEEEGIRPLPDRLQTELSVHRTLALRDALAQDPDTAFLAALHALCLRVFHHRSSGSCLELEVTSTTFSVQPPDLAASASAKAIDTRQRNWAEQLPREPDALWNALLGFDGDSRAALFAHCVSLGVNAVHESWNRAPQRAAHADVLAEAVGLDMVAAGWTPTVDGYLGRVPKVRILEAVREARGAEAARLIDHLRKGDMAKEAERLLAGSGWLPEPLRARSEDRSVVGGDGAADGAEADALPAFLIGDGDSGEGGNAAPAEAA